MSTSVAAPQARRALYAGTPFVCLVAVYVVGGIFALRAVSHSVPFSFTDIYRMPVLLTGLYLFATLLYGIVVDILLARRRPRHLETWRALYERRLGTRNLVGLLVVLAVLPAFLDVMIGFRMSLTDIRAFAWDPTFAQMDYWLHFGRHPWELIQPVVGHPAITILLDRVYVYGWFGFLWLGVIWQAVHGREPLRLQFFLAFAAAWILLGTVAAIAFSSAGPVYFGRVTGLPDPYEPLFAYLYSVDGRTPLHALSTQEKLWLTYRTWGGITAMPSMHLAITTVVALAAYRHERRLIWAVGPLWLLMLVGSVHLGWHYAIDSYAGIVGALAIWIVAGRFATWWIERRTFFGEDRP